MESKRIAELVSSAIKLDREIKEKAAELAVKKRLLIEQAAIELQQSGIYELVDVSYKFNDAPGQVATVSFPKDRAISTFEFRKCKTTGKEIAVRRVDNKVVEIGPLKDIAGDDFKVLFAPAFKPAKDFANLVALVCRTKPKKAEKLLELCTEESSPRVSFETADAGAADREKEKILELELVTK